MGDSLKEGLKRNNLEELNRCRIFMKATYISYIRTGDGNTISIMSCNGIDNNTIPRYECTTNPKPNQKI